MEKKTIGKFISVLRRAAGMTQKELGEKLYVSDKTVSRWERDECTPELSLIPAIAEIFDITTDELLRGERNAPQSEVTQSQKSRSDRQLRILLHNRKVRFRNLSVISLGVALASAILAFVINETFYKGTLAFGIGAVLTVGALVCQFCFASSSLLRLDDEDEAYEKDIRCFNSDVVTKSAGVLAGILSLFAFILPMGIWGGSYYGLSTGSALGLGCLFAALMAAVCHIIYVMWVRKALVSRGAILDENEHITAKRRNLLKRSLLMLLAAVLVLGAVLLVLVGLGPESITVETHQFTDPDEFCAFMEKGTITAWQDEVLRNYADLGHAGLRGPDYVCIDIGDNGLFEEVVFPPEFDRRQITGSDGSVLCDYVYLPIFVSEVEYSVDEATGDGMITVRSHHVTAETVQFHENLCSAVLVLMVLSVAVCTAQYLFRLCKIRYPQG